jgi:hypothetical protein
MATEAMEFCRPGIELSAKDNTRGSHSFHAASKVPTEDTSEMSESDSLLDEDAEGEEDDELDEIPAVVVGPSSKPVEEEFESEDEEELSEEEDSDEEAVGAVKIQPRTENSESGEDEDSSSGTEDSDSNSSDGSSEAESDAAPEWDVGSEGAEGKAGEIAARNNCMSVFVRDFTIAVLTFSDSVARTRMMTRAKNSRNIWPVLCVVITVSSLNPAWKHSFTYIQPNSPSPMCSRKTSPGF